MGLGPQSQTRRRRVGNLSEFEYFSIKEPK
jgi:hypothetical protein